MKGKRIFITGGAGYLGSHLVARYYDHNEITVYSRDEAKHYYLKKKFPAVRAVIGDIRNLDLLCRSARNHDIGIFSASLKQIEAVDQNVEESVRVIVDGALNSRRAAEEAGMEAACFISSDKSRAATTLYGAMKFVAGEAFIVNSNRTPTRLSCAVYGNVLNSTGSIIPLIWDSIKKGYELTLYSERMTRFMIGIDEAMDLIEKALKVDGYNVIPNLKSFTVGDLFGIYERFGLKYKTGMPRISEKLHETMVAAEEIPRTSLQGDAYFMHYEKMAQDPIKAPLSSESSLVTREKLEEILRSRDFFKP